jgi:hypothetical protein
MGSNSRDDRARPVQDREAREARALQAISDLVRSRPEMVLGSSSRGQLAEVLSEVAIELNAGRAVPLGVRRAVRGLADALRAESDPRTAPSTDSAAGSAAASNS